MVPGIVQLSKEPVNDQDERSVFGKNPPGLVPAVPFDDAVDGRGRGLNIL